MESTSCTVCHNEGYLDLHEYCDCAAGTFHEAKDELTLQLEHLELDIGCNLQEEVVETDVDLDYYSDSDYYDACENAPWISEEEWYLHDIGKCPFPCSVCSYDDSTK